MCSRYRIISYMPLFLIWSPVGCIEMFYLICYVRQNTNHLLTFPDHILMFQRRFVWGVLFVVIMVGVSMDIYVTKKGKSIRNRTVSHSELRWYQWRNVSLANLTSCLVAQYLCVYFSSVVKKTYGKLIMQNFQKKNVISDPSPVVYLNVCICHSVDSVTNKLTNQLTRPIVQDLQVLNRVRRK
jgi:hypothetical protein